MNVGAQTLRGRLRAARSGVRRGTLDLVCRLGRVEARWQRLSDTPRVQILLLHELPSRAIDRFRRLLSLLQEKYTFVSYSDAIKNIVSGQIDRPQLAFSFDDGLRNCASAAGVLEEFGATGMFFICPDIVGADSNQQARVCRERLWIEPAAFLSWNEIVELNRRGHEFGSHTLSHANLATIDAAEIATELRTSKTQIADRLGSCHHFAWPYGRFSHFNHEARRRVFSIGFRSCASGVRGSHAPHVEAECTPCIRRESINVQWRLTHIKYFLEQGSRRPYVPSQSWPTHWGRDEQTLKRVA